MDRLMLPGQCRAARALIDWTQDQLAEAARVSRPTVADFEKSSRRTQMISAMAMQAALYAAGVEFIGDDTESLRGVGVRLRERQLKYISGLQVDGRGASLQVEWGQTAHRVFLPRTALENALGRWNLETDAAMREAVSDLLPEILNAAEAKLRKGHDGFDLQIDRLPKKEVTA